MGSIVVVMGCCVDELVELRASQYSNITSEIINTQLNFVNIFGSDYEMLLVSRNVISELQHYGRAGCFIFFYFLHE